MREVLIYYQIKGIAKHPAGTIDSTPTHIII